MVVDQSQQQGEECREVWPHTRTQHCEDHGQHPEKTQLLSEGDDPANINLWPLLLT